MELLKKNNTTGAESSVPHFDQNFDVIFAWKSNIPSWPIKQMSFQK